MNPHLPRKPVVYAAGPAVFWLPEQQRAELPPAARAPYSQEEYLAAEKAIFTDHGLEVHQPLDTVITPFDLTSVETPRALRQAYFTIIEGCDAVIANLNDFRGPEPDSGTVVELAYGYAKGAYPCAYISTPHSYAQRCKLSGNESPHRAHTDTHGAFFEDFTQLPGNLMWAELCLTQGVLTWQQGANPTLHPQLLALQGLEACVAQVARKFRSREFTLRTT